MDSPMFKRFQEGDFPTKLQIAGLENMGYFYLFQQGAYLQIGACLLESVFHVEF